jgi:hypothetical protein
VWPSPGTGRASRCTERAHHQQRWFERVDLGENDLAGIGIRGRPMKLDGDVVRCEQFIRDRQAGARGFLGCGDADQMHLPVMRETEQDEHVHGA